MSKLEKIIEIYAKDFKDVDMKRSFERECLSTNVLEMYNELKHKIDEQEQEINKLNSIVTDGLESVQLGRITIFHENYCDVDDLTNKSSKIITDYCKKGVGKEDDVWENEAGLFVDLRGKVKK